MPAMSLEEVLQSQILGMNRRFKEADADLHQEVAAVSAAVGKIKKGLKVELTPAAESDGGITYNLLLKDAESNSALLGSAHVPVSGYPIKLNANLSAGSNSSNKINDQLELKQAFIDLANNPDSALVRQAAFFARRARE